MRLERWGVQAKCFCHRCKDPSSDSLLKSNPSTSTKRLEAKVGAPRCLLLS